VTDDHLSLDELAELDEGLLAPERISAIRAHLHGCEDCRARAEAITSTRAMLADLPAVTMPEDIKARLDQALAQEAASHAEPAAGDGESDEPDAVEPAAPDPVARSANVTPDLATVLRPRFARPTMAASAAAAALVLALGAIVVGHHRHHTPTTTTAGPATGFAPTAPAATSGIAHGSAQPKNFVQTSTEQDYTPASLLSTVPGLIASSVQDSVALPAPAATGRTATGTGGAGAGAPSNGSGAATSPRKQRADKKSLPPASTKATASVPSVATAESLDQQPVPAVMQPLYHSRQRLLACASTLSTVPDAVPLAIDFGRWTNGRFHKSPVAIFIFRDIDPSVVDVIVTGPRCDGNSVRTFVKVPTTAK